MRFLGVRLKETLIFQCVSSFIASAVFYFGILEQTVKGCSFVMLLLIIINGAQMFMDLMQYRMLSGARRKEYYKVNFTVVGVMTALACILAGFNIEPVFTWLFFPFKVLNIFIEAPKVVSALSVGAVFAVITAIVPLVVKVENAETEEMADGIITEEEA